MTKSGLLSDCAIIVNYLIHAHCPKEAPIHAPGHTAILLCLLLFGALIPRDIPGGHYNESLGFAHFPQTTGTIRGVVIDAQDRPIANASVAAHRHTNQPASRNDRAAVIAIRRDVLFFPELRRELFVVAFKEPQYPDSSFFGISEATQKSAADKDHRRGADGTMK